MMLFRKILLSLILGATIFSVSACEREEGALEETGEQIEESAEKAGDKLEDATD